MLGIKRIVFGMLVGGGTVYFADHYHLVHTTEGVVMVPRAHQVPLRSSYADVRGWDAAKWAQYPELAEALAEDGRGGLLIHGVVDDLMKQAGHMLGTTPSATPTGVTTPERPPIVFESLPGPVFPGGSSLPSAPQMQSATDDSLLGRLSRQLQANPAESPPVTTPPPRTREQPETPSAGNTFRPFNDLPQANNSRAGVTDQILPEDLYPSIHSAAMQRITSEVARPVEALQQQVAPLRERVLPAEALPQTMQDVAAMVLTGPNGLQPSSATSPAGHADVNPSNNAHWTPLDIEGARVRERLPPTVQDAFRMLTPQPPPQAQQPTVNAF